MDRDVTPTFTSRRSPRIPRSTGPSPTLFSTLGLGFFLALSACASQAESTAPRLPFHVAIVPVASDTSPVSPTLEGSATELQLTFEDTDLTGSLSKALEDSFFKVTTLSPRPASSPQENHAAWLEEAKEKGADLILDATLSYHPTIHTQLNDWFWPNLGLFAIGGPFNWLVGDRSYYFQTDLSAHVFDVASATRTGELALDDPTDDPSRIVSIERETGEAPLNFIERADGVVAWGLSLLLPSGLLSSESDDVPAELQVTIARSLCRALASEVRERGPDVTRWQRVEFYPDRIRMDGDGSNRHLVGEMVLEVGDVTELTRLGYRFGPGPFVASEWTQQPQASAPDSRNRRFKRYPFRLPVGDADAETVQVEVEQDDSAATKRTFTFAIPRAESRAAGR